MNSNELLPEFVLSVVFFEDCAKIFEIAGAPFLLEDDRIIYASDQALVVIIADELIETAKGLNQLILVFINKNYDLIKKNYSNSNYKPVLFGSFCTFLDILPLRLKKLTMFSSKKNKNLCVLEKTQFLSVLLLFIDCCHVR